MTGRAMAHPRRMEFVHWLPEDKRPEGLVAIEFVPEHIDFTRQDEEGETERFQGETRASPRPTAARRWWAAAYGGLLPALTAAVVIDWGWIGWFGQDYPLRAACLMLSLLGTFALLGGARLLYRAAALRRFQAGRVRRVAADVLAQGWLDLPKEDETSLASGGMLKEVWVRHWFVLRNTVLNGGTPSDPHPPS